MTEVANNNPATDERVERIRRAAAERFQRAAEWVSFYREVLGIEGIIDRMYPQPEERKRFEQTAEYMEIQQMLAKLREKNGHAKQPDEPTRVITVRLPQSLHEALRNEAYAYKTSMNKLCISKLLQVIAAGLVPADFERQRPASPVAVDNDPEPVADERPEWGAAPAAASFLAAAPLPSSDTLGGGRPF